MNRTAIAVAVLTLLAGGAPFAAGVAHASTVTNQASGQSASASTSTQGSKASATADQATQPIVNLNAILVTGTTQKQSVMKQSVSVTTMNSTQIQETGATNTAAILGSVPGVHAESSGGEGNANLTVRGLPISAGGSRYVQYQENGLPVLLFGDLDFATPDEFMRSDFNTSQLQVVRGGAASTLASNAPGGIVNFIDKTGRSDGGDIGFTEGLNYRLNRLDFDYGGHLSPDTRFHFGGFFREGNSSKGTNFTSENGGQFKFNVTKDLNNGSITLYFKHLDDKTPTYLDVPVRVVNGQITTLAGVDPRTYYPLNGTNIVSDSYVGPGGQIVTNSTNNGLSVKSDQVGVHVALDLEQGLHLDDKFSTAQNSGNFLGLDASQGGQTATTYQGEMFDVALNNLNNTFNNLQLSKDFVARGINMHVAGGLFTAIQNVAETWNWNVYTMNIQTGGATLLGTGTTPGIGFGCGAACVRNFSVQYTENSPFVDVAATVGKLSVDASVRHDSMRANGWQDQGVANSNPTQYGPYTSNGTNLSAVNYSVSHTSYSVGANYRMTPDLAYFARYSDGVSMNGDRILYGNPLNGSTPIPLNEVKQQELGVKWKRGGFSMFSTLFAAQTQESNYDLTQNAFTNNTYHAYGLELEAGYLHDAFGLHAGLTYTHSRIVAAPTDTASIGKIPQRLPDLMYQVTPTYSYGKFLFGGSIIGQSSSYADNHNTLSMPAFTFVNAFVNYNLSDRVTISLAANNLFNKLAYTEANTPANGLSVARAIMGRTVTASLRYSF